MHLCIVQLHVDGVTCFSAGFVMLSISVAKVKYTMKIMVWKLSSPFLFVCLFDCFFGKELKKSGSTKVLNDENNKYRTIEAAKYHGLAYTTQVDSAFQAQFPNICRYIIGNKVIFWSASQYSRSKLKQLSTSVSLKVVDIYLHIGE